MTWTIYFILLLLPAFLGIALLWIQIKNAQTRSWRRAAGLVTSSRSEARTTKTGQTRDDSTTGPSGHTSFVRNETIATRNVARVTYAFDVEGRPFQSSRIELGADNAETDVVKTLRRYPKGRAVTVLYDPDDPSCSILERVDPKDVRRAWFAVAALIALITGGVFGAGHVAALLEGSIRRPEQTPFVMVFGAFALALGTFAIMIAQKGRQMRAWPQAEGVIVESAVATTQQTITTETRTRQQTMYVPRVVYRYSVGGLTLDGDSIGATMSSSTPASASRCVSRFPVGMAVTVFYDPDLPTNSTLDRSVGHVPAVLAVLTALFLLGALAFAGLIPL